MRVVPGVKSSSGQVEVYIEVGEQPDGMAPASLAASTSTERLEAVGGAVAAACKELYAQAIKALPEEARPSEISVEFGISLKGSIGVPVISQAEAEASFTVSAKWTKS